MEAALGSDPETDLMQKLDDAARGYTCIEQEIEHFGLLKVSKHIEKFLQHVPDRVSHDVLRVLQDVGNLYRRVEDEVRNYLNSAKDFAEENMQAVEGVYQHKYEPEEALANFEESLENLKSRFRRVYEGHSEVYENLKSGLKETEIYGFLESLEPRSPSNPSQVNPLDFAAHASSSAANMATSAVGKATTRFTVSVVSFLYGFMSYTFSKSGSSREKVRQIWKNDFATIEDSLQATDDIINKHMATLNETVSISTGLSARFAGIEMVKRQTYLIKAVDTIYSVSKKLSRVANALLSTRMKGQ